MKREHKQYGMGFKVWEHLTDDDAWFLKEEDHKIIHNNPMLLVPPSLEKKAAAIFDQGFTNWKGVYGSEPVKRKGTKFIKEVQDDPLKSAIDKAVRELRR